MVFYIFAHEVFAMSKNVRTVNVSTNDFNFFLYLFCIKYGLLMNRLKLCNEHFRFRDDIWLKSSNSQLPSWNRKNSLNRFCLLKNEAKTSWHCSFMVITPILLMLMKYFIINIFGTWNIYGFWALNGLQYLIDVVLFIEYM